MSRATAAYQAANQRFIESAQKNYIQQYSHIYCKRLLALRPALESLVQTRLSSTSGRLVDRVVGLQPGERVAVVGTTFKEQHLRHSVLEEFTQDFITSGGKVREHRDNFFDAEKDVLWIEDESGRCALRAAEEGNEHGMSTDALQAYVQSLVTGVVVACIGQLDANGLFVMEEMLFPGDGTAASAARPARLPQQQQQGPPRQVLLCSGLFSGSVEDGSSSNSLALSLLLHHVHSSPAICHVVVAGGLVGGGSSSAAAAAAAAASSSSSSVASLDAKLAIETQEQLVQAVREADYWLAELASAVRCDILPGVSDPVGTSLPQQPLNACLFPKAGRLTSTVHRATNPHAFTLSDQASSSSSSSLVRFLGHAGQPVRDAMRYVDANRVSELDMLQSTVLKFRHLAPTAPDTLTCYPFHDRDPFVLESEGEAADVVFAGQCAQFASSFERGVRFVCVPNFATTRQAVLVDLDSPELACRVVEFKIQL